MAWRIEEQVIRGELDNRVRGRVTGRIWLAGRERPLELALAGNPWRDLAGRRIEFVNPSAQAGDLSGLADAQHGVIGDCTASRKAKVPDVNAEELSALLQAHQPFPWHWANCVYLEWFSDANGRVVIESGHYQVTVSLEAAWTMSAAEEQRQRDANAAALLRFMDRLQRGAPHIEIAGEPPAPPAAAAADWSDPGGDEPPPSTDVSRRHIVAEQALELRVRMQWAVESRGWVPQIAAADHPVVRLVAATTQAGGKLAGALNGAWPPPAAGRRAAADRLNQASEYLEQALLAAMACRAQHLVDAVWLRGVVAELEALAAACEQLRRELGGAGDGG